MIVYVDNDYDIDVFSFLSEYFNNIGCKIVNRFIIPMNTPRNEVIDKLQALKDEETKVFIIHMTSHLGTIHFSEANNMGMMTMYYAWIITQGFITILDVLNESSIMSMQGVLET